MLNEEINHGMEDREIIAELRVMAKSVTKLTDLISELAESEIRRQERESRQDELNIQLMTKLEKLEVWRVELEIQRASESQGREALKKYWWVLVLVGASLVYSFTKSGFSPLAG